MNKKIHFLGFLFACDPNKIERVYSYRYGFSYYINWENIYKIFVMEHTTKKYDI
jgi:hypothetical protein